MSVRKMRSEQSDRTRTSQAKAKTQRRKAERRVKALSR